MASAWTAAYLTSALDISFPTDVSSRARMCAQCQACVRAIKEAILAVRPQRP